VQVLSAAKLKLSDFHEEYHRLANKGEMRSDWRDIQEGCRRKLIRTIEVLALTQRRAVDGVRHIGGPGFE